MTERAESLDDLIAAWASDEEALRNWGHERQARVVSICRDEVEDQVAGDGRLRPGKLLTTWDSDADVLQAYGHSDEAAALRRCMDVLRSTMNGGDPRGGDASADRGAGMSNGYGFDERDGEDGGGAYASTAEDHAEDDADETRPPSWSS